MSGNWLSGMLLCTATDADGFSCRLRPGHEGPHEWNRCDGTVDGYQCYLPPQHPGPHELTWFAKPTEPGSRHDVHYSGTESAAAAEAMRDTEVFAGHDWYPVSRHYDAAASGGLDRLLRAISGEGPGRLTVVYEYRPDGPGRYEPGPDADAESR